MRVALWQQKASLPSTSRRWCAIPLDDHTSFIDESANTDITGVIQVNTVNTDNSNASIFLPTFLLNFNLVVI